MVEKEDNAAREMRISGIPAADKKTVANIAKNRGMTISTLMKPVIQKLIQETPERYHRDPD